MEEESFIASQETNADKRKTLEVAEAAREKDWKHPSFAKQLFMGDVDWKLIHPFPQQTPEEKAEGDLYIDELSSYLSENLDADLVDETRTIPPEVIDELFKRGVFAMKVPKEYGGKGFSQVNYNRVMMALSSYCGSTAVTVSAHQSIGVPEPLRHFGTDEQKAKYYPEFSKGSISALALTEEDVGSDPARLEAEAKISDDGSHYILNGTKLWCTNGPIADVMVVIAKTAPKIVGEREIPQNSAFIVEKGMEGISVKHRCDFMGIRGIQNGLLEFKDVKIPKENLMWEEGRGLALVLRTLNTGRLTIPAACAGMAKQCLSICRRWGKERVQWGMPIGLHEAGRHKLAFISSTTFALEAVTWLTSHWADRKDLDIRIEAAMAKLFCTEAAWTIADMTLQFRGGRGYERARSLKERGEDPYPVERIMRDSRINTIIEGTSEIMRLILAREALDSHLKIAMGALNPKSSLMTKVTSAVKMVGFYGVWYPKQWVNGSYFSSHPEMGSLDTHCRFIDRTAHKLSRTLFHQMAKYQQNLEKKQVLLGHLMDIGTELFAMSATCSYAVSCQKANPMDHTPSALADHFCRLSRRRIVHAFKSLGVAHDKGANKLAESVLDGDMQWLEEGIIGV